MQNLKIIAAAQPYGFAAAGILGSTDGFKGFALENPVISSQ